ncbi:MAG: serine protease [Flavobacterium sp.]|nr:serine protease [Flavobacterium sp.]
MSEKKIVGKEVLSGNKVRQIYDLYASGVAYIASIDKNRDEAIGTCFHIGDNVFITARHVVDNYKIKEIGTTIYQRRYFETEEAKDTGFAEVSMDYFPQKTSKFKGPYYHPDDNIDIAALVVDEIQCAVLPLGDHLDDWLGDEFVLSQAVIMGYPIIPFSQQPLLISSKCEINAIVDKYTGGHPHFILSSMARGGFSGGPALSENGFVLGVATESLVINNQPTELGYLSVMSVEGIYNCIAHHKIVPECINIQWDGYWNKESKFYSASESEHVSIDLYTNKNKFYLEIFSFRPDIIEMSIREATSKLGQSQTVEYIHEKMIKIDIEKNSVDYGTVSTLFNDISKRIESLGIQKLGN